MGGAEIDVIVTIVGESVFFMIVVLRVYIWKIHLTVLQRGIVGNRKLPDYAHLVCKDPWTHP